MIDNTALQACPFCEGSLALTWHNGEDCYLCNCCGVSISLPQASITHLTDIINSRKPANEPLTCEGCMDYDLIGTEDGCYVRCDECKRLIRTTDYYRRKPEGSDKEC